MVVKRSDIADYCRHYNRFRCAMRHSPDEWRDLMQARETIFGSPSQYKWDVIDVCEALLRVCPAINVDAICSALSAAGIVIKEDAK